MLPDVVDRVLDELDQRDKQAPGMRLLDDEPLDEHTRNLAN